MTEEAIKKISKTVKKQSDRDQFVLAAKIEQTQQEAYASPAQKGAELVLPQLALRFEDGLELAEPETCLYAKGWDLLSFPAELSKEEFSVTDDAKHFTADIQGRKVVIQSADSHEQLSLEGIHTPWTELELSRWLDKRVKQGDVKQPDMLEFLRKLITYLIARSDLDMAKLVQGKFVLEKIIRDKINSYRQKATERGFQECLFSEHSIVEVDIAEFSFSFDPKQYPASRLYDGKYKYKKHYYPRIAHMNNEESEFAFALDINPLVEFWVRNLERNPDFAFWLPTSSDKFYPDFIAKLKDGRLLVCEYKGGHLLSSDDTKEKANIGELWAVKSGHVFLLASTGKSGEFRDQINDAIS